MHHSDLVDKALQDSDRGERESCVPNRQEKLEYQTHSQNTGVDTSETQPTTKHDSPCNAKATSFARTPVVQGL